MPVIHTVAHEIRWGASLVLYQSTGEMYGEKRVTTVLWTRSGAPFGLSTIFQAAENSLAAEEIMKAVLALIAIYVLTFVVVIQGASQNSIAASPQETMGRGKSTLKAIDPAKEADIHSLMELIGARDMVQEAQTKASEQLRENLVASIPDNEHGQQFVNEFVASYQKKFNPDDVTNQLVGVYDQHFTADEIKGLLQFYGSPLGQKVAAEMPKVSQEMQAANRAISTRVAKEALQDLRKQYPGLAAQAKLQKQRGLPSDENKKPAPQTQAQALASQP